MRVRVNRVLDHVRRQWIGTLTLFLVLTGGTAYALDGQNTVFSDDIVNGEVKVADIGQGAVETPELKNDAVTSPKVLNGTLIGGDVADNALKGADIDESTLSSIAAGRRAAI